MPDVAWSWVDILRLLLAVVCGIVIGFEREILHKPAGVRTIGIVTLGGCLVMLLGLRLHEAYGAVTDPVRMASQVITGIGFLGAGVIIQTRMNVQGLTTAAVVWLMAVIGLAIGAGWYVPALAAVLLCWLGLRLDPLVKRLVQRRGHSVHEEESCEDNAFSGPE
jgi:putative Mg2+ transporter-C (MgtC) family protein